MGHPCGATRKGCNQGLHPRLAACDQVGTIGHRGSPCRNRVAGTDIRHGRCRLHGGNAPNAVQKRADAQMEVTLRHLGIAIVKEPQQALLEAVYEAAGNVAFLRQEVQALGSALVGDVIGATKDGDSYHLFATSEEERAMVKLYGQWNDRLVKYAKAAIDAGIAERAVRIAEQQADAIVRVVNAALAAVELTSEQREAAVKAAVAELRTYDVALPAGAERN